MPEDWTPSHYDYDGDLVVDAKGRSEPDLPPVDTERFLASMARYLIEGNEREEARMLLQCTLEAKEDSDRDGDHILVLKLRGPRKVYEALDPRDFGSKHHSFDVAATALLPESFDYVDIQRGVALAGPQSADWRNEMLAILEGRDVDNQAIGFAATQTWEGLRFRSQSEVRIAEALDRHGVMFFPNCKARLGHRTRRRNSEADFAVMIGGVWGVLEVDGPHHEGKASSDHDRDRPFHHHGAAIVQRYEALRCYSDPDGVVLEFLKLLHAKAR